MNIAQHNKTYNSGVLVERTLFDVPAGLEKVTAIEKLLHKYNHLFGQEAALVAWVQPCGGPTMEYRVHKLSDITAIRNAYVRKQLRDAFPQMGLWYNLQWCRGERVRLTRRYDKNPDKVYLNGWLARLPK